MSIESELDKTASYLRRARQSIIGRGGEISLTAGLKDLPNAIFNIPADASLAHYTDNGIAYRKSVPVGAEKYALLKSVGGMTYKCKNLIPYPYINKSYTISGITFTDNGDGTITANGTATDQAYFILCKGVLPIGKYFLSGASQDGLQETQIYFSNGSYSIYKVDTGSGVAIDVTKAEEFSIVINILKGTVVNNVVFKPMLNEGTTALPYERYYEGLRDSKVTEIKSHGANASPISTPQSGLFSLTSGAETSSSNYIRFYVLSVEPNTTYTLSSNLSFLSVWDDDGANPVKVLIAATANDYTVTVTTGNSAKRLRVTVRNTSGLADTSAFEWFKINHGTSVAPDAPSRNPISKPIPKALQDIDGYGMGAVNSSNTIDFDAGKYIQRVKKFVFDGTESWTNYWYPKPVFMTLIEDAVVVSNYVATFKGICSHYTNSTHSKVYNAEVAEGIANIVDSTPMIAIRDNRFSTLDEFKSYLAKQYAAGTPVTIVYQLANPIETDIEIDFDNFIEVESGGALEFENEHKNAVPSTVKYAVKVGS